MSRKSKMYKVVSIDTLKDMADRARTAALEHRAEHMKTGSNGDLRVACYLEGQRDVCDTFIKNLATFSGDKLFGS